MRARTVIGALAALFLAAIPLKAEPLRASDFLESGGETSVPYGWDDFCKRYTGECEAVPVRDVRMTPAVGKMLDRINRWVNKNIEPISDMDHWSLMDQWDYPTDGKGDCEDYVLLKRKLLAEQGLPLSALLVTVVKDQNGDGHAVLTVRTDKGDYVLDNMSDTILPWRQVPYRFVKRQAQTDPNTWVSIGPSTAPPLAVSR